MSLTAGQTLNHYRIDRQIGAGGMGTVFLAEDTKLERKVALKVLPAEMASDAGRLERFRREAKAVASLNHPHIVTIHSVEECGETHFLTMELIEGESLDHGLLPGGLPMTKTLEVGIAMADALSAAHEKGIIHRDLKPANVMVTRDGWVKVLDFGVAKLVGEPGRASIGNGEVDGTSAPTAIAKRKETRTAAGMVVGTLAYMSPEQVGGEAVDARTDIFSLGVVLYELATGRRPFEGRNPAETISAILRDAPLPVTEVRKDAPQHLGRIIDHCLRKDPRDRYQTARDVFNDLRALRKEVDSDALLAGGHPASTASVTVILAGTSGAAVTNSLAVLPFTNMSSDPEQEYFSDGLTEEMLNVLTKVPELKVAGRTSSFSFKGKNEDLRTIGQKLGVANILEGSVRKAGNRVRITAQLVNTKDGFHLWSETYDRTLHDIFALQDDIAGSVAQALQITLLGKGAGTKVPGTEAYDMVLQARFLMQIRTKESVGRAREILERALTLSPDYAPAWAELGLVYGWEYGRATAVADKERARQRGRDVLRMALELDPGLAMAHSRMAHFQMESWEFGDAERSIEKALAADPKNPIVIANAGLFYLALGRRGEAIALIERALEADPLNVALFTNLAASYTSVGRYDEAEALCRKALDLRHDDVVAHEMLAYVHLLRGQPEEARSFFAKNNDLRGGGDVRRLFYEALVEHTGGNAEGSTKAAEEFERRFGADDPSNCADIRAWRGEADAAFAWLDKSLTMRNPSLPRIQLDLCLRPLHTDPRWRTLLEKIGLPTE